MFYCFGKHLCVYLCLLNIKFVYRAPGFMPSDFFEKPLEMLLSRAPYKESFKKQKLI